MKLFPIMNSGFGEKDFLRISSCPYSAWPHGGHSFSTDQNFANYFEKGLPRNNPVRNLTSGFQRSRILKNFSEVHSVKKFPHGGHVFWRIKISRTIFSCTDRRPASLCHGPLSVMHPCVRQFVCALTFSLNIFFFETTYRILMEFHRNVPAVYRNGPLQNFLKEFDSLKNSGCQGTEIINFFFSNFWKSSCQKA